MFRPRTGGARRVVVSMVLALTLAGFTDSASAAESPEPAAASAAPPAGRSWFTSWAQSQQGLAPRSLTDQSVRMITHLSQGGDALRIRVQNTFGTAPLTVDAVTVGRGGEGAALVGAAVPVTFQGRRAITVPAGGEVWSDAARLLTRPQQNVAVSMFAPGPVVPGHHATGLRDNYLTPVRSGDHTDDRSGAPYTETVNSTLLVSAVDVRNPALKGTVVPYGSSVVDGVGSTNCGPGCTETGTNQRWTDVLARRITQELPPGRQLAVANAGISGTTSSDACPGTPGELAGLDGAARLERDVLALHGVTGVLYYYGTNDLANGCTAAAILTSYDTVFQRLRRAGIAVYVTPITPRGSYTDQHNLDRHAVNTVVRQGNNCSGRCDGVIDFDQVLKDPLQPDRLRLDYDTGDGIHANIAGQRAIADHVPLAMLTRDRGHGVPGQGVPGRGVPGRGVPGRGVPGQGFPD
ncbi:GDSL-type esterase/lipase family protein [Streptomyces sp. NPDC096310]|uniref:GDSL-type esterase/lipase family protein n=1 Tax=Streptomyces sp. NPDC096310 TaxID=3366082 RepID=UPI00380D524F